MNCAARSTLHIRNTSPVHMRRQKTARERAFTSTKGHTMPVISVRTSNLSLSQRIEADEPMVDKHLDRLRFVDHLFAEGCIPEIDASEMACIIFDDLMYAMHCREERYNRAHDEYVGNNAYYQTF